MINIKNKETEECAVMVVDMNGNICYEDRIQPNDDLELDINSFLAGIYTLIFKTDNTSFVQQIVKYG
jgi:hypothetical protein